MVGIANGTVSLTSVQVRRNPARVQWRRLKHVSAFLIPRTLAHNGPVTILDTIVAEKRLEVARLPERLIAGGNLEAFVNTKLRINCSIKWNAEHE